MTDLHKLLDNAKRQLTKTQYERLFLPIVKSLDTVKTTDTLSYKRTILNEFITSIYTKLNTNKETLENGEDIISINNLKAIIDAEKSKLV